jgi:hypothetical protein
MYDDILEEQALLWEMTKEAADKTPFTGMGNREFGDLSYAERRRIAGRRFGKDGDGKRKSLADMDIRKRDYLRSLVGRGTGFYDLGTARDMGKTLSDIRGRLSGDELKKFDKMYAKGDAKAFKALSKAEQRQLMAAAMHKDFGKGLRGGVGAGVVSKLHGQKDLALATEGFKRARRGLMIRGGLKAGATAAGLGALGYGGYNMSKKSSYDPVVEMVEDLDGWEFAKEAELRAAEILLENGIDPETFEETYPEHVKLASFPEPGDALTYEGDYELEEYNEMLDDAAYDILEELGF